jgi:hypothetical protein
MKKYLVITAFCGLFVSVWSAGCGEGNDGGAGILHVTAWGEEFIEQGIPAVEFDDGWAITFHKFIVLVHDVSVAQEGSEDEVLRALEGCAAFDLVKKGPAPLASLEATTGPWAHTAYAVKPAVQCASAVGTAESADVAMMVDEGYSVYIEGTAVKGDVEMKFAWGFARGTLYYNCHSTAQVEDGGEATVQLTIHGDHFFYNSLVNPSATLEFQVITDCDADVDGKVSADELRTLAGDGFKALDNYDVGDLAVDNLYDYLQEQSATLGHIDGEGHCETAVVPR